jgi:hypothetical protein
MDIAEWRTGVLGVIVNGTEEDQGILHLQFLGCRIRVNADTAVSEGINVGEANTEI